MPKINLGKIVGSPATINGHNSISLISGENTEVINNDAEQSVKINFLHNVHTLPFEIDTEDWINSEEHPGYTYQVDIPMIGVTENDVGQIIFYAESVIEANRSIVLSGGETLQDAVRIYAQKRPTSVLSGNFIIFEKGWK